LLGYLKATVEFALRHPEVKAEFEEYLQGFLAMQTTVEAEAA
jgi:UTP--glucose-1-phosphate uridylyltransferase